MTWTDDRVEYAISRFNAGDSAGTIAAALQTTRNTVAGFLRRQGVLRRPGERAQKLPVWTPEADDLLRAHYGKETADRIADMIGNGVTRASVIGRAARIGIAKKRVPRVRNLDEDRARSRRYYREVTKPKLAAKLRDHRKGGFYRREGPPKPATMPPEPLPAPDMRLVSLLDRGPTMCAFPIGDPKQPGFVYCGADKPAEKPYCPYHHRIVYHAISDRRADLEGLAKVAA